MDTNENRDLKLVGNEDKFFDAFYAFKCEKTNLYWSGHADKPNYDKLKKWYLEQQNSVVRTIYILQGDQAVIGYLYLDKTEIEGVFEISYAVGEMFEGKGWGTIVIQRIIALCKGLGAEKIIANILSSNSGSIRIVEKNGFVYSGRSQKKQLDNQEGKIESKEYIYTFE